MKKIQLLFLLLPFYVFGQGDIPFQALEIKMEMDTSVLFLEQVSPVWVTIRNKTSYPYTVILPGVGNGTPKLFYFSLVQKDSLKGPKWIEIDPLSDSIVSPSSSSWIKNLDSGETVRFPLFINDSSNADVHSFARHFIPEINEGTYQLVAQYYPWFDRHANSFYLRIDKNGKVTNFLNNPHARRILISEEGQWLNPIPITVEASSRNDPKNPKRTCSEDCRLCRNIKKGNWKEVERILHDGTLQKDGEPSLMENALSEDHCGIFWVSPPPDAILSSLPTYSSRDVIFKNDSGYHYYRLTWQLGIIYPLRSRLQTILFLFSSNSLLKTSEVDHVELVGFTPMEDL
ncbi:MAG: hypothetical protein LPK80_11715 [Bacteroidota bacterium]|nr:hypothetical protein [Bacteroidota bacterium]